MRLNAIQILQTFALCALLGAGGTGCATKLASDGVYQGDAVLYNADKTIVNVHELLHSFVTWEYKNRAVLPVEVSKAADAVRASAQKYVQSAINLREAYASNPTKETGDKLQQTLDFLQSLLHEAVRYMADPNAPPSPLPQPPN